MRAIYRGAIVTVALFGLAYLSDTVPTSSLRRARMPSPSRSAPILTAKTQ